MPLHQHLYRREPELVPVTTFYYQLFAPLRYVNYYPNVNPKQNEWFFDGYYWISNAVTGALIGNMRLNGVVLSPTEAQAIQAQFVRGERRDTQPTAESYAIGKITYVEQ